MSIPTLSSECVVVEKKIKKYGGEFVKEEKEVRGRVGSKLGCEEDAKRIIWVHNQLHVQNFSKRAESDYAQEGLV